MITKLVVIDSDTPAFASAISCEDYYYADPATGREYRRKNDIADKNVKERVVQFWEVKTSPHIAVSRTDTYIENILSDIAEDIGDNFDYVCLLGDGNNFRYSLPNTTGFPYKGNRESRHTPEYLGICKSHIMENHPTVPCNGYEADDGCGIIMSEGIDGYDEYYLVHIDKDLDMIPGNHIRWSRNIKGKTIPYERYVISPIEAQRNFYKQLLTGDATDNIPGLWKLAHKPCTKERIISKLESLESEQDMYDYVSLQYRIPMRISKGETDKLLTELGRLLWIQRKEGELWLPPHLR